MYGGCVLSPHGLLGQPIISPDTKQNKTYKKFDFRTGGFFTKRADKPENTEVLILIAEL